MGTKTTVRSAIGGRRQARRSGLLLAAVLVASSCGGGDDGGADETPDGSASPASEPVDVSEPADTAATAEPAAEPAAEPVAEPAESSEPTEEPADRNGVLPGDLCAVGQSVGGAIDVAELIDWGVFTSSEVTIDGGEAITPVAYADFGVLCNLDGEDFVTVSMQSGRATFDDLAELLAQGVEGEMSTIGDWEIIISPGLTSVAMAHTGADGTSNELWLIWSPDDSARKTLDEVVRVFGPVVEAIATRTTVDAPVMEAPAVAAWFACDETALGVTGLSPATLFATLGPDDGTEVEVEQDTNASFGFTECTVRSTLDFRSVSVRIQDSTAELQDTVATYLAGWPEAVEETIAGTQVALNIDSDFGAAEAFTVVDGTPLLVSISGNGATDYPSSLRAATELVLSSIG